MPDANQIDFDRRMRKIARRHRQLSRGATAVITEDGLIVTRPQRRIGMPWRGILLTLIALMGFKGFMYATLGETTYMERVALLQAGTIAEKISAWAMQPEPVTLFIASLFS